MNKNHILIALSLILFSSVAGAYFAFTVEQRTLLQLREQYESAFSYAAQDDFENAGSAIKAAEKLNYTYVRAIDAHTHIIKLAALLLLISLILPLLNWDEKKQGKFALMLTGGIILFPSSVFLQIYVEGTLFKAGAAVGALLVILSMLLLVVSLFRETTASE